MCRTGYVETARAVGMAPGHRATQVLRREWPSFGVIEVDQDLIEHAARLSVDHDLRSLDSLHLAAALVLPNPDLTFATWDRRLHRAVHVHELRLLPTSLS